MGVLCSLPSIPQHKPPHPGPVQPLPKACSHPKFWGWWVGWQPPGLGVSGFAELQPRPQSPLPPVPLLCVGLHCHSPRAAPANAWGTTLGSARGEQKAPAQDRRKAQEFPETSAFSVPSPPLTEDGGGVGS